MRSRSHIVSESLESINDHLRIRFIRNLKYSDLYARNEAECKEWSENLGQVMVRTDFHELYKVQHLLGEGGFAKVYLGEHKQSGEKFAIKAFKKEKIGQQNRGRIALRNEVEVLYHLSHENIMRLHEVHETNKSLYLVCEYLNGGSLLTFLKEAESILTTQEILNVVM